MIQQFRIVWLFVLVAVIGGFSAARHARAQSPEWKFATGDSFAISIQQTSTVQTVVDRRSVDQTSVTTFEIEWTVESMDGENANIRQTITRVIAELTMPGKDGPKTIEYDSDTDTDKHKGDAKRLAKSFSQVIHQPITITITPRGEVLGVDVPQDTLESLRQMPGSMQGRKMFEAESIREMFSQAGMQFPETIEGETWETTRKFSIGTPQHLTQTIKYSITDSNAQPLEIKFTGTLQVDDTGKQRAVEIEFENLEIEEQDSSGTILFDNDSGNCQSSQSTTMLKTRTRYRDMDVVATINSSVHMTVKRK